VRTGEPLTEGLVSLWEPLIDTVVICTMTALVIVVTQDTLVDPAAEGVVLTSHAFATVLPWFPYVLSVFVFLFAYATMIAYCYYGTKATTYLLGEKPGVELGFKLFFCAITVVGVTMDFSKLVDFSDAAYFIMAVPNVIGLYLLAPVVKREMDSYFARLARGEIRSTRGIQEHLVGSA
jgi:AGCS family alanine or glycine:cation symporter